MLRRTFVWALRIGALAAIVVGARKLLENRDNRLVPGRAHNPEPVPEPESPAPFSNPSSPDDVGLLEVPAADAKPAPEGPVAEEAAPKPRVAKAPEHVPPVGASASWVEPLGGVCPPSHPIKAKLGSRVFRRPGGPGYDSSRPDRCFASEADATRAGFKEARR